MTRRTPLTTIAAALALALALLVAVLLPADNAVYAADPSFDANTDTREIPENTPPGVNIGNPISAMDDDESGDDPVEFGNTLTYSLSGTDAASFDIDASTGQLITKAPLDAEAKSSYSVTVTVDDGETRNSPIEKGVTINVTGVSEPPLAPLPPTVVSGPDNSDTTDTNESSTSLKVVWHLPENMGRPAVSSYAVEYKKSTETSFGTDNVSITETSAAITGLDANTSYDVRVRAVNGDGNGTWSFVGTGSTNKADNKPPVSNDNTPATRDVDENTPAGENVGSSVSATDGDTTTLTYRLEGPHADLFNLDTRSGQIRTKAPLNHEDARCGYVNTDNPTACTYRVTVVVVDGAGGSEATGVNIAVDDRTEPASAPDRPIVRATEKSSTSLDVTWKEPANAGPPITSYEVQYRTGNEAFSSNGVVITGTTATISGTGDHDNDDQTPDAPWLEGNTSYEVRVRAQNGERVSQWSATGTGKTSKANHQPIFDDRPHSGEGSTRGSAYTTSRVINENAQSGSVGRVFADDQDNDKLTYKLSGADAAKFDIDASTGQIRTKAGVTYDYETIASSGTCDPLNQATVGSDRCYTVTVEVRDGLDDHRAKVEETTADDSITVKIGVRDRDEPPSTPTVTVTSPTGGTTLIVIWEAENTGPAISSYDVQYRKGSAAYSDDNCKNTEEADNCTGITNTATTTIMGLDEDTSYSVQVRAKNAEGTSSWSRAVTLKTNKGTNEPPTFTDTSLLVELTVAENTPSGRDVGTAVDASDNITTNPTYTLEGRDAGLFTINSGTGQIRTKSALNHENPKCGYVSTADPTACTYKVRVKVDDKAGGSVSKEVNIKVSDVDEPPSAPSAPRVTANEGLGLEPRRDVERAAEHGEASHQRLRHTVSQGWGRGRLGAVAPRYFR